MPNSPAILAFASPASTRLRISSICSGCKDRWRPRQTPRCFARAIPSRCRSRMRVRSNSATAPMTDNMSGATGASSPVKTRCSLRNSTATPRAVNDCTRWRRSPRFRAILSMLCTTTVSSGRTNKSSASSCGRCGLLPEAWSTKVRSTKTPSSWRSGVASQ